MGCATPFRRCGPNAWQAKKPPSRGIVAALITTVLGAAIPCRRAARLGVSPSAMGIDLSTTVLVPTSWFIVVFDTAGEVSAPPGTSDFMRPISTKACGFCDFASSIKNDEEPTSYTPVGNEVNRV